MPQAHWDVDAWYKVQGHNFRDVDNELAKAVDGQYSDESGYDIEAGVREHSWCCGDQADAEQRKDALVTTFRRLGFKDDDFGVSTREFLHS